MIDLSKLEPILARARAATKGPLVRLPKNAGGYTHLYDQYGYAIRPVHPGRVIVHGIPVFREPAAVDKQRWLADAALFCNAREDILFLCYEMELLLLEVEPLRTFKEQHTAQLDGISSNNSMLRGLLAVVDISLRMLEERFPCIGMTLCHVDYNCVHCAVEITRAAIHKALPHLKKKDEQHDDRS